MNFKSTLVSSAVLFALAGCGSSSDDNGTTPPQSSDKSTFSLGVSDAPVSGLKAVNVVFDSITIKTQGDEEFSFETRSEADASQPQMVNLLDYTGDDVFELLDDQEVPAGEYSWIRAQVINGDTNNLSFTSHVVYEDGSIAPLVVKRKGNDGVGEIQLDGFTLNQTDNDFVYLPNQSSNVCARYPLLFSSLPLSETQQSRRSLDAVPNRIIDPRDQRGRVPKEHRHEEGQCSRFALT